MLFFIGGYTINGKPILVGTMCAYFEVVNKQRHEHKFDRPFDHNSDSDAAILLREKEHFEKETARCAPLNGNMMVKTHEFSLENPHGFKATAWDFTNLGKYGGFCEQCLTKW